MSKPCNRKRLRIREVPGKWIAYESLGDACDQMGEAEQARASYRKSLELNPRSYPWERTAHESDARRTICNSIEVRAKASARLEQESLPLCVSGS